MSRAVSEQLSSGTHEVDIDGVRQVYHVHGTGPICLVHSGGPGIEWKYLRMPALERNLTLVYLEPVGTGTSGRLADPDHYRLEVYIRFVDGLIDHLGRPKVWLLGHSHGGMVAQGYALDHPDRLAGLILYDTTPVRDAEFRADMMKNVVAFAERHPDRPEAVGMPQTMAEAANAHDDESVTAAVQSYLPLYFFDYWGRENEWATFRREMRASFVSDRGRRPPFDLREQLGAIQCPALILTGVGDFIAGPRWARLLNAGIPGSRLVVLPASGHFGHLEEPETFTAAVVDFIESRN